MGECRVVYYQSSTSNHNLQGGLILAETVVYYQSSTSNHNLIRETRFDFKLYIIRVLHQTTTIGAINQLAPELYIIRVLHQTTTVEHHVVDGRRLYIIRVLHQTTTEHACIDQAYCCILLEFYIKPQPGIPAAFSAQRCILLEFYIKPQRCAAAG